MIDALKNIPQWLTWRLVQRPGQPKPTKIPQGSTTDPATWTTYEQARSIAQDDKSIDGVGFVFTDDDPFVFLDIDACGEPGAWNTDAQAACAALPGMVWETSQSGRGLHGIARAVKPLLQHKRNRWKSPDGTGFEFYSTARFMALGRGDWSGEPDADVTPALLAFLPDRDTLAPKTSAPLEDGPREHYSGPTDDAELIRRARKARGSAGAQFGSRATFEQLWTADAQALSQFYPDEGDRAFDHSAADAALMDHLAFWTGCDQARMERLFSSSALGDRPKWKERPDYRTSTIHHAAPPTRTRYMRKDPVTVQPQPGPMPSADMPPPMTVTPDKNDHRYMIAMMIETGHDPAYDEFARAVTVNGDRLTDALEIEAWFAACERAEMAFPKAKFADAITHRAMQRTYHPVCLWLDEAQKQWDGTPRIDRWLIDYAGAPDTPYTRAVSAATLIAAVRRVRRPGCKHDNMLILEGIQGAGKSTLFEALCPVEDWFTDAVNVSMDTKQIMEVTRGKWFVEAPELSKMAGAEVEHVKALLSRRVDNARLSYDRHASDWPRQFLMVGTVNGEQYLLDETGNRRFWPVKCADEIDVTGVAETRLQLWAEAAAREAQGETNALPRALWSVASEQQAQRMMPNQYQDAIADKLGTLTGSITLAEVQTALQMKLADRRKTFRPVIAAMKALGWSYTPAEMRFVKGDPARVLTAMGGTIQAPATAPLRPMTGGKSNAASND